MTFVKNGENLQRLPLEGILVKMTTKVLTFILFWMGVGVKGLRVRKEVENLRMALFML